MYLYSGSSPDRVNVLQANGSGYAFTLLVGSECRSLFIDSDNSLYCSILNSDHVIKRSLDPNDTQVTTVAGTKCPGYLPHMLRAPKGLFVTINFDLYVADSDNHRIQLFRSGQMNATTVAGGEVVVQTIQLHHPAAVVLDADEYLFIVDTDNHRVVRSGPNGFRCVIGCTGGSGSTPHQISSPQSMAFDSYGSIFVVDSGNNRVQKFVLSSNSCSK